MPATLEPPAAPAAPTPAPAPSNAPQAKPAPKSPPVINVSEMPKGDVTPTKPGSARARMEQELRKKAGLPPEVEAPAAAPAPKDETPSPDPKPVADPQSPEAGSTSPDPASSEHPEAIDPKDGKKMSPWKLVDRFKERALKAEAEALELRKQVVPEEERKKSTETLAQYEARMKEMQEDLRYFNAEKYDPDIIKANEEYQGAWKRAMSELREITLVDPQSGATRPISADDILSLVNLTLPQAKQMAKEYFPDFAEDVMAYRNEIRRLFENKAAKLEELKKNGSTRDQERQSQWQKVTEAVTKQVKEIYDAENQRALSDEKAGRYFREREGDEEWNKRIKQGFSLVDKAYSENAMDFNLTPEQRKEIVKRHAAVRNRAASWGALRFENEQLQTKLQALEKELAEFKSTTPPAGGGQAASPGTSPMSARDALNARLVKISRPI